MNYAKLILTIVGADEKIVHGMRLYFTCVNCVQDVSIRMIKTNKELSKHISSGINTFR